MVTAAVVRSAALPVALSLAGFLAGLATRRWLFARLARLAAATRSATDDAVVTALRGPVVLGGGVAGLYAGLELAALPAPVARVLERGMQLLVIALVTWLVARLAAQLVHVGTRAAHRALPSATLLPNLSRTVVWVLGGLVALQVLGIPITPVVTALGVGGLAVALALQDTRANLFGGMHVLLSRQVRPGDFVRLASGEEGYVQDVNWRCTTIRQLPNNITVVPNAKLASAVTTNYYLPDRETAVLVEVGVAYGADLAEVERVTVDVARGVMGEVEGAVPSFDPFIRYHSFGDSAVQLTVILLAREVTAQYLIKHEFIKRLHRRYRAEGIEIPFPMRTVELRAAAELARAGR